MDNNITDIKREYHSTTGRSDELAEIEPDAGKRRRIPALAFLAGIISLFLFFIIAEPGMAGLGKNERARQKIVSLAPSNTELLFDLGAEQDLIGVSSFCHFPDAAKQKPKMGSFTSAKLELLRKSKPDIVLLVEGQESLGEKLVRAGLKTRLLPNRNLKDITNNIRTLGTISDRGQEAEKLAEKFDKNLEALDKIIKKDEALKQNNRAIPRVFICLWTEPLISAGADSFISDLVRASGGINIADDFKGTYPTVSVERLIAANPDIIILPVEAKDKLDLRRKPWSNMRAVRSGKYFYLPEAKDDYLSRPTTRVTSGLHWLATRLHPGQKELLDNWLKIISEDIKGN